MEDRLRVAFQGEVGAFSQEAAWSLLGSKIDTSACRTFEEMFTAVSTGAADCLVAPIENSLAGSVHRNYDLLQEHDLRIVGEAYLRIVHNLIAPPGVRLSDLRRVYSHPVALAQCQRFMRSHPEIEPTIAYDTAGSVKMVMERQRLDEAAIAGRPAAEAYGAQVIVESVEDNSENFTRFLLVSRQDLAESLKAAADDGSRKTSILFRVANKPGSLFKALAVFALRDIDLTKIESRPIEGRPWEYSFYLDLAGDAAEPRVTNALGHLSEIAESVRVLGSYPGAGSNAQARSAEGERQ